MKKNLLIFPRYDNSWDQSSQHLLLIFWDISLNWLAVAFALGTSDNAVLQKHIFKTFGQETQRMCTVYSQRARYLSCRVIWRGLFSQLSLASCYVVTTSCQITNEKGNMVSVKRVNVRTYVGFCGLRSGSEGGSTGRQRQTRRTLLKPKDYHGS